MAGETMRPARRKWPTEYPKRMMCRTSDGLRLAKACSKRRNAAGGSQAPRVVRVPRGGAIRNNPEKQIKVIRI